RGMTYRWLGSGRAYVALGLVPSPVERGTRHDIPLVGKWPGVRSAGACPQPGGAGEREKWQD
ncbi:MAG: hypothetical protein Q7R39_18070, partial [Dehalococcoidia bacterium]|nr:hypothetical protein [Dehalococcoidia bacterium]